MILMSRRAKWLFLGGVPLVAFLIFTGYVLGTSDDHRTNVRYLKWKCGRAPQDYRWCLHLLTVDESLLNSMKGKPMSQLRSWLPETGRPKVGTWQYEWLSDFKDEPHVSYEAVGASSLAIRLRDGKFENVFWMKG